MSVNTKVNGQLVKSAGLYTVTKPIGMADIYSEEEREIGVFTDGKPLYQKVVTVTLSTPTVVTTNIYAGDSSTLGLSDIDYCAVLLDMQSSSAKFFSAVYNKNDDYITFVSLYQQNNLSVTIPIQYTKTTDLPGSGEYVPSGDKAVHYSTDEEVIGTWIDGSTIYRKTIVLNSALTLPSNTWTSIGQTISNINFIVNANGVSDAMGSYAVYPLMAYVDSNAIKTMSCRPSDDIYPRYLTFEYTKSS